MGYRVSNGTRGRAGSGMKLIIDMNLSPKWVGVLAQAGIDAMHWATLGAVNAPDSEITAYARSKDCVVPTHELDFGAILAATQGEKPSVVQIRADDVNPRCDRRTSDSRTPSVGG